MKEQGQIQEKRTELKKKKTKCRKHTQQRLYSVLGPERWYQGPMLREQKPPLGLSTKSFGTHRAAPLPPLTH